MQRTIEKLVQDRRDQQDKLRAKLVEVAGLSEALGRLESGLHTISLPPAKKLLGFYKSFSAALAEIRDALVQTAAATKSLAEAVSASAALQDALADARDKEWDALGNNHVGMIFKSLEWRVDRLAEASEDASALIKTFALLKDQLGRLLASLEEKKLPTPAAVREVLDPIEDWHYLRFENRFRGAPAEIKRRQQDYADRFPAGGSILDLGCGRGEFLEILRETGRRGSGVDLNAEMIGICRANGLEAVQGDLLEELASRPDAALDGVFSAQVIEHISPAGLRRLVELAFAKLAPGGVILLETVNPLSVFALVHIYFLDPTHRFPVHPEALRFLLEAADFKDVEIFPAGDLAGEKLQTLPASAATAEAFNRNVDRLNRLLFAAPVYAAVGRRDYS